MGAGMRDLEAGRGLEPGRGPGCETPSSSLELDKEEGSDRKGGQMAR